MKQAISYRDNSGFVVVKDRAISRYVSHSYAAQYNKLMQSGLYDYLVEKGLLIPHTEASLTPDAQTDHYRILIPEFITCISYPYEWTAAQWKQVVLKFLEINLAAIKYGMILKDATPFNFSFHNGKAVFIDTLSFELYNEGDAWIAYRQFCESMLGPLALAKFNSDSWTKLLVGSVNGWDLPFISRNLRRKSWLDATAVMHIHWHARYNQKPARLQRKANTFSSQKLEMLWSMMHRNVSRWLIHGNQRQWLNYYQAGIESIDYLHDKTDQVDRLLKSILPKRVIDLGANTGRFSLLAAQCAAEVIAAESDQASLQLLQEKAEQQRCKNITTILADIAEPTPAVGWGNAERVSLLDRLHGDMVLALALVHHLCISRNIPMPFVAKLVADMTDGYAIVEFVPKSDMRVKQMLYTRPDIFDDYTEQHFVDQFSCFFELIESHTLEASNRKLFVWRKK